MSRINTMTRTLQLHTDTAKRML